MRGAAGTGAVASAAGTFARRAGGRLLDGLLPPRCFGCGTVVADPGVLCAGCWSEASFVEPPLCIQCGYPFELDFGGPVKCGACLARPPAFERARAVFAYDAMSRKLVIDFKHGDRTDMAPALARWMARAGAALLADAELVAPVPLHRRRLFLRQYNQAALLARLLARDAGRPCLPDLLTRARDTPSQGRLSAAGRRRNVTGAFRVPAGHRAVLKGARVLLVDDVMTTGATAEACARRLKRSGAAAVDLLCIARVVRTGTT